jgi:hypothetical protein
MFDDRRRDHVALGIRQGLLLSADLEPQRETHVVAQFLSDGRCPGLALERNENGSQLRCSLLACARRLSVWRRTGNRETQK